MPQETQWDLRNLPPALTVYDRLFVFLTLGIVLVTAFKFLRIYQAAKALRIRDTSGTTLHEEFLARAIQSLNQWLVVPFFAWGFLAAMKSYHFCTDLIMERNSSVAAQLSTFRGLFTELEMSIMVSFTIFLSRWYAMNRLNSRRP